VPSFVSHSSLLITKNVILCMAVATLIAEVHFKQLFLLYELAMKHNSYFTFQTIIGTRDTLDALCMGNYCFQKNLTLNY